MNILRKLTTRALLLGIGGLVLGAICLLALTIMVVGGLPLGLGGPPQQIGSCEIEPNADCPGLIISGIRLAGADLHGANLAGAQIIDSDLSRVNLSGVDLTGARLERVDLSSADLSSARLVGGTMDRVKLARANLARARLYGAGLKGLDLSRADLRGALLYCKDISSDSTFGSTRAPNGILIDSFPAWQTGCRALSYTMVQPETGLTAPCRDASLQVVDKNSALDSSYTPDDLVELGLFDLRTAPGGSSQSMRYDAAAALAQLFASAQQEGLTLLPISAFRSYQAQDLLFSGYVERERRGESGPEATEQAVERANRYSAMPGHSEHQLGTVVDVSTPALQGALDNSLASSAEGRWLAAHAHEFGFAFSYPEGKEALTGYMWEPWHLRWVGPRLAQDLYSRGYLDSSNPLTLSTFLAQADAAACAP